MVPFIDLKRFEEGFLTAWEEKVSYLSKNAMFIGGSEVQQLEEALCSYLGVDYSISCANGTDALQLALRALDLGKDDVVLVPDMTFWATFESVINVGAKVVTVDISLDDGAVDIDCLQEAITTYRPKAAVIAHLFGWSSAKIQDIRQLCTDNDVLLLEDGAQCFGVQLEDEPIYKQALISTTSFYPAKVFGAAGDGGAVFTNDQMLATRTRQLSNHGRTSHYGHGLVGWNSRLDSLQAAYLNLTFKNLNARIRSRQYAAAIYREKITNEYLTIISPPSNFTENGYCNVCLVQDEVYKKALQEHLKSHNIGFGNIYPSPMSQQEGASKYLIGKVGGDNAAKWCASVLNLPLFPYMTEQELNSVIGIVNNFE